MSRKDRTITLEKSFSKLLDQYDYQRPKRGQFIDAEIMQIEPDHILLDLGGKTDGVVTSKELRRTDQELIDGLSEGDFIPVYILRPPTMMNKSTVSLQRGAEKKDWDRAQALLEDEKPIKLKITGQNKGGLLVKFGLLEGFLPASLCTTVKRAPNRKIAGKLKRALVGQDLYLKVIKANPYRKRLIFSAKGADIEKREIQDLQVDDVRQGIVVNLVDYGAFIDLFGVDGLLHISELDYFDHSHPSEVLELWEKIEVKVIGVNAEEGRISLSRKALINPLEEYALEPELAA